MGANGPLAALLVADQTPWHWKQRGDGCVSVCEGEDDGLRSEIRNSPESHVKSQETKLKSTLHTVCFKQSVEKPKVVKLYDHTV